MKTNVPGGKGVTSDTVPMHKKLAMGKDVQTGAGKGATGGKSYPKTPA